MSKKQYLIIFLVSLISASVFSNLAEKKVRSWVEVLYELVTGQPMVYDITQTDEKGIPYIIEAKIGKQRNPMTVCNKALSYHDKFIHGDSSQLNYFLNCADWLTENVIRGDSFSVLKYDYDWAIYHMTAPWRSGLANGVSLQVFVRAHEITRDEKYLTAARQILNSFYVEVRDGGVSYKSEHDGWWFEEFSDEGGYESRVLNGHMFALLGIHEHFVYTKDSASLYLYDQGLLALRNNIAKYDNPDGPSFYDRRGTVNIKYHYIHIDLLSRLLKISNDAILESYYEKWKAYEYPSLTTRLITPPMKPIELAIWLLSFVMTSAIVFVAFYVFHRVNQRKQSAGGA